MPQTWESYKAFGIGVVAVLFFIMMYFLVGAIGVERATPRTQQTDDGTRTVSVGASWPGPFDGCVTDNETPENCYREPIARGSMVKQPYSVVSAYFYCLIGLGILWVSGRRKARGVTGVPEEPFFAWLGFVALFMGPGAVLFHGTLTAWGGWFDEWSMYLLLAFMSGYNVMKLARKSETLLAIYFVAFALVLGVIATPMVAGKSGLYVFVAMAVLVAVFEIVGLSLLPKVGARKRSWARLWGAFGMLGLSLIPWAGSNPSFFKSTTGFPFHFLWHMLSAFFIAAYAYYLTSETPAGAAIISR